MAADESDTLDIVLAGDGSEVDYRRVVDGAGVAELPLALSEQLGIRFRIGKLPYAVLIGTDGRIAAQGLVNSREQIESLLTARDLGISSLQHFLARQSASTDILAQA
jgi:methylamine dehydrogenase accessory protein MauD